MAGYLGTKAVLLSTTAANVVGNATISGDLTVDTDTLYVDSTNNRVGIGTDSPGRPLDIYNANPAVRFTDSDGSYGEIVTGAGILAIRADHGNTAASSYIRMEVDGSEAMRIDSSGNVGIGTDSPSSPLHIDTNADGNILQMNGIADAWDLMVRSSGSSVNTTLFSLGMYRDNGAASPNGVINFGRGGSVQDGYLTFDVNGSEAMRIDSSANVLVGKTNTTAGVAGIELRGTGLLKATVAGTDVSILNRLTSDGDIIKFQKDGSTVGNIGASGGDLYVGTGDTTLKFSDAADTIVPTGSNGATRSGFLSLGNGSNKFKDLFLSGGVYLGGTGSANKLDDYEEGGYTIGYGGLSLNYSNTTGVGRYVKVGKLVTVYLYAQWDTANIGSGSASMNLPFTPETNTNGSGNLIIYTNGANAGIAVDQIWTYCVGGNSNMFFRIRQNGGKAQSASKAAMFANGTNTIDAIITYHTDA